MVDREDVWHFGKRKGCRPSRSGGLVAEWVIFTFDFVDREDVWHLDKRKGCRPSRSGGLVVERVIFTLDFVDREDVWHLDKSKGYRPCRNGAFRLSKTSFLRRIPRYDKPGRPGLLLRSVCVIFAPHLIN